MWELVFVFVFIFLVVFLPHRRSGEIFHILWYFLLLGRNFEQKFIQIYMRKDLEAISGGENKRKSRYIPGTSLWLFLSSPQFVESDQRQSSWIRSGLSYFSPLASWQFWWLLRELWLIYQQNFIGTYRRWTYVFSSLTISLISGDTHFFGFLDFSCWQCIA